MYYTTTMSATFETEKNRKALLYTTTIVVALLLIAILWTWQILPPPTPVTQDLIEINLGNYDEGFGTVQPLIKGEKSPGDEPAEQKQQPTTAANNEPVKDLQPDDNADEDAAPIVKPEKPVPKAINIPKQPNTQPVKNTNPVPAVVQEPKPQKPKIAGYAGPKGATGNGATEDNGYTYQGNKPGGKGDAGDPTGKPDSYGNTKGGKTGGGPRVTSGDRKIIRYYSFTADLDKATIYALIKVSPEGKGTFTGFGKNSTSRNQAYANEIIQRLPNIQFDKADHESAVTVQFNFTVQ
ncbi:MAG: hypothetical protein RIS73_520 [Bacteroidota bacterium]|jgi:outer membrane biosynthesis protein TonB